MRLMTLPTLGDHRRIMRNFHMRIPHNAFFSDGDVNCALPKALEWTVAAQAEFDCSLVGNGGDGFCIRFQRRMTEQTELNG